MYIHQYHNTKLLYSYGGGQKFVICVQNKHDIRPTNPYISVDLHNHVVGHMSITVSTCLFIFVVAVCQLQVAQKKLFLGTVY